MGHVGRRVLNPLQAANLPHMNPLQSRDGQGADNRPQFRIANNCPVEKGTEISEAFARTAAF